MCEFCVKHGEGKKWYHQAQNYSTHLIEDHMDVVEDALEMVRELPRKKPRDLALTEALIKVPLLGRVISSSISRKMKGAHFGQVVPVRDVEELLRVAETITVFPCLCRQTTIGARDERCCFGLGVFLREIAQEEPDFAGRWEAISRTEAMSRIEAYEKSGLVQTVWTLKTPFIVGLCNCKLGECLGLNFTVNLRTKLLFKSEYIVQISPEICIGCRRCAEVCNFGAIIYQPLRKECIIDAEKCYGCALCASACETGAVDVRPREGKERRVSMF